MNKYQTTFELPKRESALLARLQELDQKTQAQLGAAEASEYHRLFALLSIYVSADRVVLAILCNAKPAIEESSNQS